MITYIVIWDVGLRFNVMLLDIGCVRERTVEWTSINKITFNSCDFWHMSAGTGSDNSYLTPLDIYGML